MELQTQTQCKLYIPFGKHAKQVLIAGDRTVCEYSFFADSFLY